MTRREKLRSRSSMGDKAPRNAQTRDRQRDRAEYSGSRTASTILVRRDGDRFVLVDGLHRLEASCIDDCSSCQHCRSEGVPIRKGLLGLDRARAEAELEWRQGQAWAISANAAIAICAACSRPARCTKTARPDLQMCPACQPPPICDGKLNHDTLAMARVFQQTASPSFSVVRQQQ